MLNTMVSVACMMYNIGALLLVVCSCRLVANFLYCDQ